MSSILRGTRLILNHSLRRVTYVTTSRGPGKKLLKAKSWTSTAFSRNLSTDPALHTSPNQSESSSLGVNQLSEVERRLELLDSNVRWRGRIDREDVEGVLSALHKEGHISEQQALMLLRCSGSLMVKESPEKRMEIFQKIWKELESNGCDLKTAHHNAALRVQMDNKHDFSVTDILSEMESAEQKKPNRVTFQLLLARYCELGDVEGATKILQYMKTERMAINETVFNSLIKGHLKKGDIEGANGVIQSMRSAGLETSNETYKVILCCHAEKGDMAAMQQTFEDAQKDEVNLSPRQIYEAVLVLADSGHESLIEQLLTFIRKDPYHDALNCAHQLIARGHDDAAFQVYLSVPSREDMSETSQAGARSIIRTMVLNERPYENIKKAFDALKSSRRLDEDNTGLLAMYGLNYGKGQIALEGIKSMNAEGLPVRPHFFWPLFITCDKNKDHEGMYNAVSVMADFAEHNNDYISTLYAKVFKRLVSRKQDPTAVVTKFQESGVKTEDINSVQLLHLLESGKFTEAHQFIENSPFTIHIEELKTAIAASVTKNQDVSTLCKVVKAMQGQFAGFAANINGDLLNTLLNRLQTTPQEQLNLAECWIEQDLPLGPLSGERAMKALTAAGAEETLLKKISDLALPTRRKQAMDRSEAESMTAEQLENELKIRKRTDRDLNTIRKQLLLKYCQQGNIEKADALKSSLEKEGFICDAMTLRQLTFLAVEHKEDLEEGLMYKQLLETNFPEFKSYTKVLVSIATLQAKKGDFEGALKSLMTYAASHGEKWEHENFGDSYEMIKEIKGLVDVFKKDAAPSQTRDLVQAVFDHGFVKVGTFSLLQEVTKAYIDKEDYDGLIDTITMYHREYNRVPFFGQIFRVFIKNEDAARLQKVVDLMTSLNGEMPVLQQLVLAFIDCGQVKKARKILETPGLRANMPVLKNGIDNYVQMRKEEELRNLIDVTQNLFAVDHDEMLFGLMRLKAGQKDSSAEQVMDVLAMYEEQGVKPRARTLRYLAKVLESKGEPVPFEVPVGDNKKISPIKAQSSLESEVAKAVRAGEIETVCNALNKRSTENPVSTDFISETASHVLTSLGHAPFKRMVYAVSEQGDIDSLQTILGKQELPLPLLRFTKQQLFKSKLRIGQAEEIMAEIEADPLAINEYLSPAVLATLVENQPDLLPKVEDAVELMFTKNPSSVYGPNTVFDHWVLTDRIQEAETLWKSHEDFRNKARLMHVATQFREENNEDKLRWLLSLTKEVSVGKQALIYSQLVALKNATGDINGALDVCREARDAGLEYSKLWGTAMKQLEVQLLAANQQPPWEVGLFDQGKRGTAQSTKDIDQSTQQT